MSATAAAAPIVIQRGRSLEIFPAAQEWLACAGLRAAVFAAAPDVSPLRRIEGLSSPPSGSGRFRAATQSPSNRPLLASAIAWLPRPLRSGSVPERGFAVAFAS